MADDMDSRKLQDDNKNQLPTNHSMSGDSHPVNTIHRESYWFAHGGPEESSANSGNSPKPPEGKDAQTQKEREERIRQFREQQEEERAKRMKELEQTFVLSKKYREQQEEERRRKIEEARVKENERRQQVEERKRQIWEAEQERKEAILRRNLEREARIEARRNAQRNSLCFAFGSSTPRTFDLDLAALGRNSGVGCPLMSAVSGRRSEERDFASKRATSACSLDRKPDSFDLCVGNSNSDDSWNDPWRSMSVEPEPNRVNVAKQIAIDHMRSEQTKACLTMDDNISFGTGSPSFYLSCPSSRWLVGSGAVVGDDIMSWSTTSLSSSSRGRRRTDLTPVTPRERSTTPHSVPRAKNVSHSPSRPQSSMSGRSENSIASSQASAVILRPKVAPRKPRPVSIAGTTVDRAALNSTINLDRKPRSYERNVVLPKPPRAKSTEPENIKKPSAAKKPVPPPKSAQVLARARSHPVPTKDNLRKAVKALPDSKSNAASNAVNVSSKENMPPPPSQVEEKDTLVSITSNELSDMKSESIPAQESKVEKANTPVEPEIVAPAPTEVVEEITEQLETKAELQVEVVESPAESKNPSETVVAKESISAAETTLIKSRITSEEEARAALAEKRRLAREQAEREAELERQRQEELLRQEEERKRQEELEQKRQEEEQIRLAELHRQLEEEKLRKAIEEQEQRENEERERREEEARLKAEKEEQERRAREEAEKQRIELEERLRKEEQERAERKRRVEQIMSRTRGKGSPSMNSSMTGKEILSSSENNETTQVPSEEDNPKKPEFNNANDTGLIQNNNNENSHENIVNSTTSNGSVITNLLEEDIISKSNTQPLGKQNVEPYDLDDLVHNVKNGFHSDSTEQTFLNSVSNVPKRTSNVDSAYTTQTNGYSSHEDTSLISSPEERSEKSDSSEGLLLELQSTRPPANNVTKVQNQLIDISSEEMTTTNSHNDSYVFDVVNSNVVSSSNPFLAYEDNLPKKQENTITDLLS